MAFNLLQAFPQVAGTRRKLRVIRVICRKLHPKMARCLVYTPFAHAHRRNRKSFSLMVSDISSSETTEQLAATPRALLRSQQGDCLMYQRQALRAVNLCKSRKQYKLEGFRDSRAITSIQGRLQQGNISSTTRDVHECEIMLQRNMHVRCVYDKQAFHVYKVLLELFGGGLTTSP
jgi:hypothetical protein